MRGLPLTMEDLGTYQHSNPRQLEHPLTRIPPPKLEPPLTRTPVNSNPPPLQLTQTFFRVPYEFELAGFS